MEATTTAAQRESAAAQREAALARYAMEATTAAAPREAAVATAAAQREALLARDAMEAVSTIAQQAKDAIKEAADTMSMLQLRTGELLRIKGLSLRGGDRIPGRGAKSNAWLAQLSSKKVLDKHHLQKAEAARLLETASCVWQKSF